MENKEGLTLESTTLTEQPDTQQESDLDTADATAPQEQKDTEDTSTSAAAQTNQAEGESIAAEANEPFLSVKFNHETQNLSQTEAALWAQKGMKYEKVYEKICRAAAINGKEPTEFIEALESAADAQHRQSLIDAHGDNPELIEQLMELYNIKKEQTVSAAREQQQKTIKDAEESTNARIADEFSKMVSGGMFPEIKSLDSIPDSVMKAASEGMPLAYAYLLHKHSEQIKIETANKAAEDAAKKTTGSMSTDEASTQSSADSAFMQGFWGR